MADRLKSWQNRDRLTRTYKLPSCGWLYGDKLMTGVVTMSAMRGEDEEIVAGAGDGMEAFPVLRDVVERLVDLGGKLSYKELLFTDWVSLLFNFMSFSYGGTMQFNLKCPKCRHFPPQPYTYDLDTLPSTIYDTEPGMERDKFREPFTSPELPPYGDVVNYRLLRLADMLDAEAYFKKATKVGKPGDFMRSYSVAKHIAGINGEEVTLFDAMDWVRNATTGETLRVLRQDFASKEPGYAMTITLTCPLPRCGAEFGVHLPEDGSFFRRSDSQLRSPPKPKILDSEPGSGGTELSGLGGDGPVAKG